VAIVEGEATDEGGKEPGDGPCAMIHSILIENQPELRLRLDAYLRCEIVWADHWHPGRIGGVVGTAQGVVRASRRS
jgi:hypothetical protein